MSGDGVVAEILTIGDELLRGEIVDSNKSFMSDRLLSLDVQTHWHTSVRDDPAQMTDAFQRAAVRADVVLVSGGLGPTRDDLTSQVLAESFGRKLVRDEAALEGIRNFFRAVQRQGADIEIVAVNDLGDQATMAHLLKYDSVLGNLPNDISAADGGISMGENFHDWLTDEQKAEANNEMHRLKIIEFK